MNDEGRPELLAFVWMDRDRRYFISSASSLRTGEPYTRFRWRQVDETANAEPQQVQLTIPQPQACEVYYKACGMIDRHNRCRQDTLQLERKLGTLDWSMRVNMSLLAIIIVDSWLLFKQCTKSQEREKDYYTFLAEELIDNQYNTQGPGQRRSGRATVPNTPSPSAIDRATGAPRAGIYAHLTPTKKKRKTATGELTKHMLQGRCRVCKVKKTLYLCSACLDENEQCPGAAVDPWICYTKSGSDCFAKHISEKYDM